MKEREHQKPYLGKKSLYTKIFMFLQDNVEKLAKRLLRCDTICGIWTQHLPGQMEDRIFIFGLSKYLSWNLVVLNK